MNLQHTKVKDIQQLIIIFEDYKNYLLIPINSLLFHKLNQQSLQEKMMKRPSSPPPDNKSTTASSNDESIISVTENPNNQIVEKIDNFVTFLK